MKQKTRKVILVLVCVIAMNMAIFARAEFDVGMMRSVPDSIPCGSEKCYKTAQLSDYLGIAYYQNINDSTHTAILQRRYICSAGHVTTINRGELVESHTFSNQYDDLGHVQNLHRYGIKCSRCGYSRTVEVICENWETQGHRGPF